MSRHPFKRGVVGSGLGLRGKPSCTVGWLISRTFHKLKCCLSLMIRAIE